MSHQTADNTIAAAAPPGANNLYLLIDAAQYSGIGRILEYRFRRLPWQRLNASEADVNTAPVLLHVNSNQTRTLAWFLDHTRGLHCLSWIESPLGLADLAGHLRSLVQVEAADGTRYAMRFHDTRILPAWYQMLTPEQEAYVLAPVNSWNYLDRDGQPCALFGHGTAIAPEPACLRLCAEQERSLLEASLPDIVMERLELNGNADLAAMPRQARYAFLAGQVRKATALYNIRTVEEIVLFCSLALGIGSNFDKLMPVAQVLQRFSPVVRSRYAGMPA